MQSDSGFHPHAHVASAPQSLDDYLTNNVSESETSSHEPFVVQSTEQAIWCLRKLRQARQKLADQERAAAGEMARLRDWLERQQQRFGGDITFFESALIRWHEEQMAKELEEVGGNWARVRKTRDLPGGRIIARRHPDSWVCDDPTGFLSWAQANDRAELIRVKTEPNIANAKRLLAGIGGGQPEVCVPETGELVPGLRVVAGEVAITVELEGE